MQNRRKQKVIIGTLCAIIIGMVVGYAALSQILNINGTSKIVGNFDIQFMKISENIMTNATTIKTDGVGTTTATFNVDLKKPGSSAIYDVTVENKGTIDAVLKSIEGLDESNLSEPLDIKYSLIGLEEGDELNASASKSFQVKVIWDSTSTSIPSQSKSLTLKLNYEQKTSSSGGGSTVTPESCFTFKFGRITDYTCTETDVIIPDTIDGESVTIIDSHAFSGKSLTSVQLPQNLSSIGIGAFQFNYLEDIVIPDGVILIETEAFAGNRLTSVSIPNGLETINTGVFSNNLLSSVTIPNSVTTIGDSAFSSNMLTSVNIPNSVTTIGMGAFETNGLTSITLPDNVTTIEEYAFSSNRLTTVRLGKGVTTIGERAFWCDTLTSIVNPTGRAFNWSSITGVDSTEPVFITGVIGNITITAE